MKIDPFQEMDKIALALI